MDKRMALSWDDDESATKVRSDPNPITERFAAFEPPIITIIGMPVIGVKTELRAPVTLPRPLPPPRRVLRSATVALPIEPAPTVLELDSLDWDDDEDRTDLRAPYPGLPCWDGGGEPSTRRTEASTPAGPPAIVAVDASVEPSAKTLRGTGVLRVAPPESVAPATEIEAAAPTVVSSDVPDEVARRRPRFDPRATEVLPNPHIDPLGEGSEPSISIEVLTVDELEDRLVRAEGAAPTPARPQSLASVPPMVLDSPLGDRPTHEGRWSKVAGVSSVLALAAVAAMLVMILLPRPDAVRGAALERTEIFVDAQKRCDIHPSSKQPGDDVALPIEKVRLAIDLRTDGARVVLVDAQGAEREIRGPWPHSVDLEPGRYVVTASKAGYRQHSERVSLDAEQRDSSIAIDLEPSRRARVSGVDDAVRYGAGFDPYAD